MNKLLKFLNLDNERGCFGGGKTPDLPPTPAPTPTPTPAPSPSEVTASADIKRKKIAALKFGAMNSIRNVGQAQGLTGNGADLQTPQAGGQTKNTIGA